MAKKSDWDAIPFIITTPDGADHTIVINGRDRWALECLAAAGERGCTPIETPGPRWSGYVFNLRQMGVPIETVTEPHPGPFAGNHARYVLRCVVQRLDGEEAA